VRSPTIFSAASAGTTFRPNPTYTTPRDVTAPGRVERLQPYHRKLVPHARTLQWLDEISNVDKHRLLHPVASMLVGSHSESSRAAVGGR
jgi:hypothetical protein